MKKIFIALFCLSYFVANAQLTISGRIIDENKNPIPFVNVVALKTTNGTVTNDKGEFSFSTKKNRAEVEISFLGFVTQRFKVNARTGYLNIILKEDANELDEIIIVTKPKIRLKKKENPAYRILKEIWKRKKQNGLDLVNAYQYKKQLTTEVGLNNLDTLFLKNIFKDEYATFMKKLPYNHNGVNYYIPLFISEAISNVYGNNKIDKERIDIEAEKSKGIQNQGYIFERVSNTFNFIDIYKDNFELLKKSFVSPISSTGFDTYDYVLQDSLVENNKKKYHIYFFPRRADLAFEGDFWVADKSFAISKIKMQTNKDINLNFVRKITIQKEFIIKDDSIYLPKKDIYTSDFALEDEEDEKTGLTVKKTTNFTNYIFDKPLSNSFYKKELIRYKPAQFVKEQNYWDSINKSNPIENTYSLIEKVKNDKQINKISKIINILSTGYINIAPKFQLGQYWNAVTSNNVEGTKLKLGFRIYENEDDRFRLNGFLGYGFKDKKIKYQLEAKYLLSYKPRIGIGVTHQKDVEQLGAKLLNSNGLNADQFDPNALFSRGDNFFLSAVNKSVVQFDFEVKKNLHVGTSFAYNDIKSAAKRKNFTIDYIDNNGIKQTQLTDVSQDFYLAYTPGRREYGFGIEQRIGRNLYPAFVFNYRKGYRGLLNGDFNYDKISFNYNHPLLLGKLGLFIATFDGGKTFGTVPLSLLSPIPANQTFWITKGTFSLINYYDFITDAYISGHFEHHFNGLIMNRIPLIKHLKLRTVGTFKTVYGTISDENIAINKSNIKYDAPSGNMYYEYGFGIENIGYKDIRPLRVDFVWRGKHKSINKLPSPKFAVRIGIEVRF